MARILDKDTRIIDASFGPVTVTMFRNVGEETPQGVPGSQATFGGNGTGQFVRTDIGGGFAGSFVQYERLDLDYMTMNNEVMQPMEVSVQRTQAVPTGNHQNGNNFTVLEEYVFVLSRPLSNGGINTAFNPYDDFAELGIERGTGGFSTYRPNFEQNIYAEQRLYSYTSTKGATLSNGELVSGGGINTLFSAPTLETVNTWGSLSAITGPNLHCYRVLFCKAQSFEGPGAIFQNVNFDGFTTLKVPPLTVSFLCKDPKYTEGEYLTRLANAMNNVPIDGEVA